MTIGSSSRWTISIPYGFKFSGSAVSPIASPGSGVRPGDFDLFDRDAGRLRDLPDHVAAGDVAGEDAGSSGQRFEVAGRRRRSATCAESTRISIAPLASAWSRLLSEGGENPMLKTAATETTAASTVTSTTRSRRCQSSLSDEDEVSRCSEVLAVDLGHRVTECNRLRNG